MATGVGVSGKTRPKRKASVKRKILFDLGKELERSSGDSEGETEQTSRSQPNGPTEKTPVLMSEARKKLSAKLTELINKVETRTGGREGDAVKMETDTDESSEGDSDTESESQSSSSSSSDEAVLDKNRPRTISILRREAFVGSATSKKSPGLSTIKNEKTSNHSPFEKRDGCPTLTVRKNAHESSLGPVGEVQANSQDNCDGNKSNETLFTEVQIVSQLDCNLEIVIKVEPEAHTRKEDESTQITDEYNDEIAQATQLTNLDNLEKIPNEEFDLTTMISESNVHTTDVLPINHDNGVVGFDDDCQLNVLSPSTLHRMVTVKLNPEQSESHSIEEQHKILQQFEKPGSPTSKKKSAFVDEELDSYLKKYEKSSKSDSKSKSTSLRRTPSDICTSIEDMKHTDIEGYRFFMFNTKKEMKTHVLATTVSKITSGKWAYEKSNDTPKAVGWRKKFGSSEKTPISSAAVRRNWVLSRKLTHGMKHSALSKLGFRFGGRSDEDSSAHIEPMVLRGEEKYAHMKIHAHKLALAGKISVPVLQKALKTLSYGVSNKTFLYKGFRKMSEKRSVLSGKYRTQGKEAAGSRQEVSSVEHGPGTDTHMTMELNNSFEMERHLTPDVQYDYDDTDVPVAIPLPDVPPSADDGDCVKDTCSLGCVCGSLQKSSWKRVVEKKHCGELICMFGCVCMEAKRMEQSKKAIWDGVAVLDDDGRVYDSSGKLRSSRSCRPSKAAIAAFETEEYFTTSNKRKSKDPVPYRPSPLDRPKSRTASRTASPQNTFQPIVVVNSDFNEKSVKKEKLDDMVDKIISRNSELVETPNEALLLIPRDPRQRAGNTGTESRLRPGPTSEESSTNTTDLPPFKSDLQTRLAVLKNYRTAVALKSIDKEGRVETRLVHSLRKRVDSPELQSTETNQADLNLDIGDLLDDVEDDDCARLSCARTTVYVPVRLRQHNTNTAPRYDPTMPKPITIEPIDDNSTQNGGDRNAIDVEKLPETLDKIVTLEQFKLQMVLLQRKKDTDNEENIPHLLEIHSNCDWDSLRAQILGKISVIADVGKYPEQTRMTVSEGNNKYLINTLPRGAKPTRIPPHLVKILKTNFMYAIRLKITRAPKVIPTIVIPSSSSGEDNDDLTITKEERPVVFQANNKASLVGQPPVTPVANIQRGFNSGLSAFDSLRFNAPGMHQLHGGGLQWKNGAEKTGRVIIYPTPSNRPVTDANENKKEAKVIKVPLSVLYNQLEQGKVSIATQALDKRGKVPGTAHIVHRLPQTKVPQTIIKPQIFLRPTGPPRMPVPPANAISPIRAPQTLKLGNGQTVLLVPVSQAVNANVSTNSPRSFSAVASVLRPTVAISQNPVIRPYCTPCAPTVKSLLNATRPVAQPSSDAAVTNTRGRPRVKDLLGISDVPETTSLAVKPASVASLSPAAPVLTGLRLAVRTEPHTPPLSNVGSVQSPTTMVVSKQSAASTTPCSSATGSPQSVTPRLPGSQSVSPQTEATATHSLSEQFSETRGSPCHAKAIAQDLDKEVAEAVSEVIDRGLDICSPLLGDTNSQRSPVLVDTDSQESITIDDVVCNTSRESAVVEIVTSPETVSPNTNGLNSSRDDSVEGSNALDKQTRRLLRTLLGKSSISDLGTCESNTRKATDKTAINNIQNNVLKTEVCESIEETDADNIWANKSPPKTKVSRTEVALVVASCLEITLRLKPYVDGKLEAHGGCNSAADETDMMLKTCQYISNELKQRANILDSIGAHMASFVNSYLNSSSQLDKMSAMSKILPTTEAENRGMEIIEKCERLSQKLLKRNLGYDPVLFHPEQLCSGAFEIVELEENLRRANSADVSDVTSPGQRRKRVDPSGCTPGEKRRKLDIDSDSEGDDNPLKMIDVLNSQSELIKVRLLPQLQNIVTNFSQEFERLDCLSDSQASASHERDNTSLDDGNTEAPGATSDMSSLIEIKPIEEEEKDCAPNRVVSWGIAASGSGPATDQQTADADTQLSGSAERSKKRGFYISENPDVIYGKSPRRQRLRERDMMLNHPEPKRLAEMLKHNHFDEEEVDIDDDVIEVTNESAATLLRQTSGISGRGRPALPSTKLRKRRKQGLETRAVADDSALQFVEELVCVESRSARRLDNAHLMKGSALADEVKTQVSERKSLALHCVRERHRRLELANYVAELAAVSCPKDMLQVTCGKLRTPKYEVITHGIMKIHFLHKEHTRLKELHEEQLEIKATLIRRLKNLKARLRTQYAGVTRDETTGATVVCEEPE